MQRLASGVPLRCAGCGRFSEGDVAGWCGYRTDLEEDGDPPEISFFCPVCVDLELDDA